MKQPCDQTIRLALTCTAAIRDQWKYTQRHSSCHPIKTAKKKKKKKKERKATVRFARKTCSIISIRFHRRNRLVAVHYQKHA